MQNKKSRTPQKTNFNLDYEFFFHNCKGLTNYSNSTFKAQYIMVNIILVFKYLKILITFNLTYNSFYNIDGENFYLISPKIVDIPSINNDPTLKKFIKKMLKRSYSNALN